MRKIGILIYLIFDFTIIVYKIDGYPIDGGPVYIEVTDILCDVMD